MNRKNWFLKSKNIFAIAIAFAGIYIVGCEKYTIEGPEKMENVSFKDHVVPIFNNNCISCHGGAISPNLKTDPFTAITNGKLVSVSAPETSKLYDKLISSSTHQSKATPTEKLIILTWIEEGAKNN